MSSKSRANPLYQPKLLYSAFLICCHLSMSCALARDAAPQQENSLAQALRDGTPGIELLYRFEFVDQDNFIEHARASTLRTRLNYRTGAWHGLSSLLEFDDISEVGADDYNGGAGTTPGRERFPIVADPADTHLNQAYLNYQYNENLSLRGGRQRIKLDQDRFIGNVGWRQNEQTYDGVSFNWKNPAWDFFYAYIANVNRIFGNDVPAGDHDHNSHLLHLRWQLDQQQSLTAYTYVLDNNDISTDSNTSYGIRYQGNYKLAEQQQVQLLLEYALQQDHSNNPVDYSADYWHGTAIYQHQPWLKLQLGYERLDGDRSPGQAFRTPLATLHAFNGWADIFINTPQAGLEDHYAGLSGSHGALGWQVFWHRFGAETNSLNFGTEWDAAVSYGINKYISVLVKAALFDASATGFNDTKKFWTMLSAKF